MKPENKLDASRYFLTLLIVWAVMITLAVTAIIYNNSPQSAPIFLFLLASGVAIMAGKGLTRAGILALFIVSISIAIKQFIGAWSKDSLLFNLLESFLMAGTLSMGGYYHDILRKYFGEYDEAKEKLKILDLEDTAVGLIKPAIGLLRLKEESDRAIRFKRPFSMALILVSAQLGKEWNAKEKLAILRAVATTIKDTTRVLDIPFLINHEKIALILTDTEINGTNKVLNNIQLQLNSCRIILQDGSSQALVDYAQIRFGYSVFMGYSNKPLDLMEAAELSLQRNIEMNAGGIFQNLFIDWELVGESPSVKTILPSNTKGILDASHPGLSVIENFIPQEG